MATLEDVSNRSQLLDIQGDLERAVRRAKAIDLRKVTDPDLRALVLDVRTECGGLLDDLRDALS